MKVREVVEVSDRGDLMGGIEKVRDRVFVFEVPRFS